MLNVCSAVGPKNRDNGLFTNRESSGQRVLTNHCTHEQVKEERKGLKQRGGTPCVIFSLYFWGSHIITGQKLRWSKPLTGHQKREVFNHVAL